MTRVTRLLSALALTGATAGAFVAACGHPGSPGEMPPVSPRPDPSAPGGTPMKTPNPMGGPGDAGVGMTPGPVTMRTTYIPAPVFAPVVGSAAKDAGVSDGYTPPLPPIPDGGVAIDARVEPR